jgi:multidrug transporter EmrE-like cation transporter
VCDRRADNQYFNLAHSMISLSGLTIVLVASTIACAANLLVRAGIDNAGGFQPTSFLEAGIALSKLLLEPKFAGGVVLYILSMLIWFRIISSEPLSVAYPVMLSLTVVMVTLGAAIWFHEQITLRLVLGIAIILIGITVVAANERPL